MRYLLVLVLCLASTGLASSDSSEVELLSPEAVKAGKDALEKFNLAPRYVNEVANRGKLKTQLLKECDGLPILRCLTYLYRNEHQVMLAVPDHPAHWEAWAELLAASPFGVEPGILIDYENPRADMSKIIDACNEWMYRAIASRQTLDVDSFLETYRNHRRLSAGSETLIEKMIFTACLSITHYQMQVLMPIYAAQEDRNSILKIRAALTPFSREERSLRKALHGDLRYSRLSIDAAETLEPKDFPDSDFVPLGTLEELKVWAKQVVDTDGIKAANASGDLSELSWSNYWGRSDDTNVEDDQGYFSAYAMLAYVGTTRSSEVPVYLNQALADVYLGFAPIGQPTREPPAYFYWRWVEETAEICLVPMSLAARNGDFSADRGACASYIDPDEVRDLIRR